MTDTTSAAPSEQDLFERVFPMPEGCMRCGDTYAPTEYSAWAASAFIERYKGWQAARRAQPTPPAVVEPPELSPDFTDTARAALLWVLWHHQGGSSPVGQPIRFALGMGQYDSLNEHQLYEAKRWERLHPVNPAVFPRGPEPLSDDTIMNAFCNTPELSPRQMVSCFIAGARFAEQAHGIGIKNGEGNG